MCFMCMCVCNKHKSITFEVFFSRALEFVPYECRVGETEEGVCVCV